MMRFLLPAAVVLILSGAACAPVLSPELSQAGDPNLTFAELRADPEASIGKIVILCGVIASINGLGNGTELEVLQKEPDLWGRPIRTAKSGGRFLVRHKAMLDPLIYSPGREITVGGAVKGADRGMVLIDARETRLWERPRPAAGDPSWMDPLSDRDLR